MRAVNALTVLVVEDDGLVREDIVLGLQQEGWIVLQAATGAGALKALQETNTVDLLITDIRLADALAGWDIAEAFRASSPIGAVIPCVRKLGQRWAPGRRECLSEQASDHLQPFGCLSEGSARDGRQLSPTT
jgi:CheY-like chemotaxis protein